MKTPELHQCGWVHDGANRSPDPRTVTATRLGGTAQAVSSIGKKLKEERIITRICSNLVFVEAGSGMTLGATVLR